jgi:hypothetical protein
MKHNVIQEIRLPKGIEVDLDEGWRKIISRQFGGNPGRAASELLQNAIDSYDADIPVEKRRIDIDTRSNKLCVTDYGTGLDLQKLQLMVMLGGTDKDRDENKIGFFGVGFVSIFNPKLATQKVAVTTCCEDSIVELVFTVKHPEKPPEISVTIKKINIAYSTRVSVEFGLAGSVRRCLDAMQSALKYYPCPFRLSGHKHTSVWERAKKEGAFLFQKDFCRGFIETKGFYEHVTLLCKYEKVMSMSVNGFLTGGHRMSHDLDDYYQSTLPFVPGIDITVNSNQLHLTISRDGFYLDYNWVRIKQDLGMVLQDYLEPKLKKWSNELIVANQFILRDPIRNYLQNPKKNPVSKAVIKLANAPIYRVSGQTKRYSLVELKNELSKELPLFYSEYKHNLRWLGGQFKHDYIVLPETCRIGNGALNFYDKLFATLFTDVVNLDTISHNRAKLKDLVERDIIDEKRLAPEVEIVGEKVLLDHELKLLEEIAELLQKESIRQVIAQNLCLPVRSIRPVFIALDGDSASISSGVLDDQGHPLSDAVISNFATEQKDLPSNDVDILLGLALDHPFVRYLTQSDHSHRAFYSLTYIAHELALSQRLLVPYSQFYHLVKERLAGSMRRALIEILTGDSKAA